IFSFLFSIFQKLAEFLDLLVAEQSSRDCRSSPSLLRRLSGIFGRRRGAGSLPSLDRLVPPWLVLPIRKLLQEFQQRLNPRVRQALDHLRPKPARSEIRRYR